MPDGKACNTQTLYTSHSIFASKVCDTRSKADIWRLRAFASFVLTPPRQAPFRGPVGAPEPLAPPCMRQRALPLTAACWHSVPRRVLALQRGAWLMFESRSAVNCARCRLGLGPFFLAPLHEVHMSVIVSLIPHLDCLFADPASLPSQRVQ